MVVDVRVVVIDPKKINDLGISDRETLRMGTNGPRMGIQGIAALERSRRKF